MTTNRSVPANVVLPHVTYPDVDAAVRWLTRVFGFVEHYRYGNPPAGAQLRLGDAWIQVNGIYPGRSTPALLGGCTQTLTIFVDDVERHCARATVAGATIVEPLNETPYGEQQYGALDLAGHRWLFARHARDVNPADWATLA